MRALEGDAEALKVDLNTKNREYREKINNIKQLQHEVDKLESNGQIKVSEHAIIRYLERVRGIDISEVEREILDDQVVDLVGKLGGNGTYPAKGFRVIIRNYTVTTVIE